MRELLKLLEIVKNYVLAIASGVYGLGLLCWMYYSWKFNLGHLDAFEAQYFITGIFPALTVLYFYWLKFGFPKLRVRILRWIYSHTFILKALKYLTSAFLLLFLVNLLVELPYIKSFKNQIHLPFWLQVIFTFILLNILLLVYPALFPESNKKEGTQEKKTTNLFELFIGMFNNIKTLYLVVFQFFFWLYLVVSILVLALGYVENFYPNLPQELGGVKPKKVILITEPSAFSLADQLLIFPDAVALKSGQTDTLLIYFYNEHKFIFKSSREVNAYGLKAQTFEIDRASIKSIKWLIP